MGSAEDRLRSKSLWETFRCPGGALSLDFCNSGQGARNSTPEEWLGSFADLVDWLEAAGAIDGTHAARLRAAGEKTPDSAEQLWRRALAFREALSQVFLAKTDERRPDAADLNVIDEEYARTARFARLATTADGFAWGLDAKSNELDAALRPLVTSAAELLTSPKLARLRRCGSATCYWLFIDETKNCSRRWCEMASCGNRMKVRRHRARQGASGAAAEADHPKAR